jgi:glycosyltransferase involved in cell wall biosynthesis
VTPSYNTGRYIGAAVQSVLDQDCPNVDYIVLDGGSTDKTVEVLKSFGPRLRWISEKDGGQSDAIKRGYAMTGQGDPDEILGWLNSDDTYAPGAFREVAQYFADHPEIDLLYGDATYTDWDGKHIADCVHIEPYSLHRLCRYSDFMVQPATFVRRRAYEAVGGVDAAIHWAMDYDLWLRIAVKGFKVAYLPKVLAHFRWLAENKTATGGWGRLNEIVEILKRVGFGPTAYIRLEMCNMHARESIQALGSGKVGTSIHAAAKVAGTLLASPRAVGSLFSPHTWRIMWVGQVLRARAAAEQQSHLTPPITASGQAGA